MEEYLYFCRVEMVMITIKPKKAELLSNFKKQVDFESIFVADSALYSEANLL